MDGKRLISKTNKLNGWFWLFTLELDVFLRGHFISLSEPRLILIDIIANANDYLFKILHLLFAWIQVQQHEYTSFLFLNHLK